jgi:glycine/D-amino acid oxidase-like deaminating enzyme
MSAAPFPSLRGYRSIIAGVAYVDCTPDAIPVISAADQIGGLTLAAGCPGHGFGLGRGIGHLAAELIANDTTSVDAKFDAVSGWIENQDRRAL